MFSIRDHFYFSMSSKAALSILAKAQSAGFANKRLFACVSSHMCSKDLSSSKLLLTKLALEPEDMRKLDVSVSQAVGAKPL